MVSKGCLAKRSKRRERNLSELKQELDRLRTENVRLKKIIALDTRKADHGCTNFSCTECYEMPDDGTMEI